MCFRMNPYQTRGPRHNHVHGLSEDQATAGKTSLRPTRMAFALALGALLAMGVSVKAQTATLTDLSAQPDVGTDDISQLIAGSGNPDSLNYYFDNSTPPGQTFTTGNNANGYQLGSLSILTAGNSGSLPSAGQTYYLRIYSMSGSTATLLSTYASTNTFTFIDNDWLQWTGLNNVLLPNTQYAYTFARGSSGWENLSSTSGNPLTGGEVALIPPNGGTVTYGSSHAYDATFIVGLTPITQLQVAPPTISPSISVTIGTTATLSVAAAGPGTLQYQWRTDGGTGGSRTNIPSATTATLTVDTTGYAVNTYHYDVVVGNGSQSITSSVATLAVYPPVTSASLADIGASAMPLANDITQYVSGGLRDGLNYYDDNGANHDSWPGQTFTTGTNDQGYYLTAISFLTGGGGTSGVGTAQTYELFIYTIENDTALLMAHYTNGGFSFADSDWLQWSGFNLTLRANSQYAYAFGRSSTGTGWEALAVSPETTDLYAGGQICLLPSAGGTITYGTTGLSDSVFDIGVLPIGVGPDPKPYAGTITVSPARIVSVGTQVTLSQSATGNSPLHFQWQTDGGSGTTLTNIPSATGTNLVLDTTGWVPGAYSFDFVVSNAYGTATATTVTITVLHDQASATLTDLGATDPVPGSDDIAQLTTGSGNPDGLNYYYDNSSAPGETFTAVQNSVVTSLAVRLAGNSGSVPTTGQGYILRLYKVVNGNATLYSIFTSATNFTYTSSDWVQWTGLSVPLTAGTTYAYSFGRVSSGAGWENMANVTGDLYSGGEVVLIPTAGGALTYGSSHSFDATFVVGLAIAGHPLVSPIAFSPTQTVYAGTPVTASATVSGTGTYTYQWLTDGGNVGGALTNIPGATSATLSINTVPLTGLTVTYGLKVTSASGSTTVKNALVVTAASAPNIVKDIANTSVAKFTGSTLSLTATFDGTLPITYQWQVNKGSGYAIVAGQTNTTLNLTNLAATDTGSYELVAVNSQGQNTSTECSVSVWQVPTTPFTVNFQWYSKEGGNDVGAYSGAGITGFGTGTFWNSVAGPSTWTVGTYSSSTGNLDDGSYDTGISWTLVTGGSWDWSSAPTIPLLDSSASSYGTQTFTFTLPNGMYNLVLFSCNGTESSTTNGGAVFTINGQTQTALPTQDTSFVQGNNYVVFSQLLVTNMTLTGTWSPVVGKSYGSLNGAQLRFVSPAVTLKTTALANNQFKLEWSQGSLLEATNITGPWTANGKTSPYTVSPTETQKYYRVKIQ